jgi:transcriptional regulator with XRE-family HTH domain
MDVTSQGYRWAHTVPVASSYALGRAIRSQRRKLGWTQERLAAEAGVAWRLISQLETRDRVAVQLGDVLRLIEALNLELELRPVGSEFTPRPPTRLSELNLTSRSMQALDAAGIDLIADLIPASEMLALPAFESGEELYEISCALNRHGLSLKPGGKVPEDRDRDIFRLRVTAGLTLDELGALFGVNRERIRQVLRFYFGLSGIPPTAAVRSRRGRRPSSVA